MKIVYVVVAVLIAVVVGAFACMGAYDVGHSDGYAGGFMDGENTHKNDWRTGYEEGWDRAIDGATDVCKGGGTLHSPSGRSWICEDICPTPEEDDVGLIILPLRDAGYYAFGGISHVYPDGNEYFELRMGGDYHTLDEIFQDWQRAGDMYGWTKKEINCAWCDGVLIPISHAGTGRMPDEWKEFCENWGE